MKKPNNSIRQLQKRQAGIKSIVAKSEGKESNVNKIPDVNSSQVPEIKKGKA